MSTCVFEAIFQSTELLQSLPLSEEDVRRKAPADSSCDVDSRRPVATAAAGCFRRQVMVMAREARDIELSESRRRRWRMVFFPKQCAHT